jgi:hypothetical protein
MTDRAATTIARAVQIISTTALEWRLLMEALKNELSSLSGYKIKEGFGDRKEGEGRWICTGAAYDFAVRQRAGAGRPARIGTYEVILDLYDPDGPSGHLDQSLVYVAWAPGDDSWGHGWLKLPVLHEETHLVLNRLFVWSDEPLQQPITDWSARFAEGDGEVHLLS